ncbi:MAG: tRNA pseudouridine(55) synthase TruB [Sphingomonadaceae bacterium]|nr:tRNA pseudouridine(55) synthase TruB [Sphingomonadaceae bacterium]
MLHGWIILDKPIGLGSTTAVSAVKRILREAGEPKTRVGHGGTLDPLASGVLPIALGEATKLAGRMLDATKAYDFTITFGAETDTLDAEGVVTATSEARPTLEEIAAVLPRFTGEIEQAPPAYSALKVGGKRAYALARAGGEVVLKSRCITIHSLTPQPNPSHSGEGLGGSKPLPFRGEVGMGNIDEITLSAHVSKGTYIRSLAHDIARALGTVGHVTMLRRTRAGPFGLHQAISLDFLMEKAKGRALEDVILPLTAGLDDIPALSVSPAEAAMLRKGRVLTGISEHQGLHLASDGSTPVALVEIADGNVRVVRGFNL